MAASINRGVWSIACWCDCGDYTDVSWRSRTRFLDVRLSGRGHEWIGEHLLGEVFEDDKRGILTSFKPADVLGMAQLMGLEMEIHYAI